MRENNRCKSGECFLLLNMKITIKATNVSLTPALREYTQIKLGSLEKFLKIFQEETPKKFLGKEKTRTEICVEIGKTSLHHHKGNFYRAEAQIKLPKKSLRAEAQSEDLRTAICEIKDELQRALKKYKSKPITSAQKGARKFKETLNLKTKE